MGLNRTDFLGRDESDAGCTLVYNHYPEARETIIELGGGSGRGLAKGSAAGYGRTFEVVDLVANTTVFTGGTGPIAVTVPAKAAVVLKVSVTAE